MGNSDSMIFLRSGSSLFWKERRMIWKLRQARMRLDVASIIS